MRQFIKKISEKRGEKNLNYSVNCCNTCILDLDQCSNQLLLVGLLSPICFLLPWISKENNKICIDSVSVHILRLENIIQAKIVTLFACLLPGVKPRSNFTVVGLVICTSWVISANFITCYVLNIEKINVCIAFRYIFNIFHYQTYNSFVIIICSWIYTDYHSDLSFSIKIVFK